MSKPDDWTRDQERAREIVEAWVSYDDFAGYVLSIRRRIEDALARERADAIEQYARTVDDPRAAHLHYDECPYKPWADVADWDYPEGVAIPKCTCAEAHNGSYWKGQFVLERGYHQMTKNELAKVRAEENEACAKIVQEHAEAQHCSCDISSEECGQRYWLGVTTTIRARQQNDVPNG